MNNLITACLTMNSTTQLVEFPSELMGEIEIEMVQWALEYYRRHGELPSVDRFTVEFPMFVPVPEALPITDIFDQEVKRRTLTKVASMISDVMTTMTSEHRVPIELLNEVQQLVTVTSGVYKYSEFDRSLYVRKAQFKLPFRIINSATGGLAGGEYLLIAGRLGTGKSTLLRWITKQAWEENKRVLFISTESLAGEVFAALDGMVSGVGLKVVRDRSSTETVTKIIKAEGSEGEIFIPKHRVVSTLELGTLAKSLSVDLIVVDGVYLLRPTEKTSTSKWERVGAVSNEIKQMALDLGIPIVCSTQIKRGAATDGWYSPEDIALSDSLAQDADFVITVRPDGVVKNRIEVQLIKNRFGYQCATIVYLDHENSRVVDESVEGAVETEEKVEEAPMSFDEWKAG